MQTFAEYMTPRRGLKSSSCVGNHYMLDADMPAGVLVSPSANGHVRLPASAADVARAVGVLAYSLVAVAPSDTTDAASGTAQECVDQGDIWMICEDDVDVGDQVYARYTAAPGEQLGAVRSDADTATAALVPNARAITDSTNGLVKVRVNLPHGAAS